MSVRRALLALVLLLTIGGGGSLVLGYTLGVFPVPETYVIVKGDTLFQIAVDHEVTVAQLREWNQIEGDLIDVGQVLLLWPGQKPATNPAVKLSAAVTRSSTPSGRADLAMPGEKPCLASPSMDDLQEEEGWLGSQGLSQNQISSSMGGFVHHVLPCLSAGDANPIEKLQLEFTVACTGRVKQIAVLDWGDWPHDVSHCVTETLKYTSFPAHDLVDGETFVYPLQFRR